jgi:lysozyme family protein
MLIDDAIIEEILKREGGFVDHPADKGGPTNHGITQVTLALWRGHEVTVEEVRDLSEGEARDIYVELYIQRPGLFRIANDRLRGLMIDSAVNHGIKRAIKMLQWSLGVIPDGVIGPATIKALFAADMNKLYARVCAERARLYGSIITRNPSQAVFAKGWMNRLASFIEAT